ncbi:methylated-DNA--[protein]-cysteine S-methyltransferase [Actomonas aquatica]|uniref:Methylated-DNA--[protein]-cysteine S-methyltransferase n=1 Tax=Actomonas aquatica TaxID=2866162 RepID=A0ABZ1CBK4_9BACT|nr:methylated-DNA--[protein]-cysteine S-methyltransferase [Opitutus sp. WL0086]WRQ88941.1 methylated-DNA--[protein]-cysteine S-methyltransferase [Opitutus sp. WL0086]
MPHLRFDTVLGPCVIYWESDQLTGFALLPDDPSDEATAPPPEWIVRIASRVRAHLAGAPEDFSALPYAWHTVSDFQRQVYEAALRVKSGHTATYGDLAHAIGQGPAAARAVGTALGQNPWPLLVPCHRFVGAGGKMTGFSAPGGVQTKLRLLAIEGNQLFAD